MSEFYVSPKTGKKLKKIKDFYVTENNSEKFQIINSIPRFCNTSNYTESFGYQWNKFDKTQLDTTIKNKYSEERFYRNTNWIPEEISKLNVMKKMN